MLISRLNHLSNVCGLLIAASFLVASSPNTNLQAHDENATSKAAVPSSAELRVAQKAVNDLFRSEIAAAKKGEAKAALAKTLLEQSRDLTGDANTRYAFLRKAQSLAMTAGDVPTALQVVEELAGNFQVDLTEEKLDTLRDIVKSIRSPYGHVRLIDSTFLLVDDALTRNDYELSRQLLSVMSSSAKKVRDRVLPKALTNIQKEMETLAEETEKANSAKETLETDPENPSANLIWGTHLCLNQGDWKSGLAFLAKSGDGKLKEVATRDLSSPTDPFQQLQLADDWMEWIESSKNKQNDRFQMAAQYWYQKALPKLTGIHQLKAQKRLEKMGTLSRSREASDPTSFFENLKPLATTSPVVASIIERQVALWAVSIGAKIRVSGSDDVITQESEIPQQNFQVTFLNLGSIRTLKNADLARLKWMTGLKHLSVGVTGIGDEGLMHIRGLTTLEILGMWDTQVTNEGLKLLTNLKNLHTLECYRSKVTTAGLNAVRPAFPKMKLLR